MAIEDPEDRGTDNDVMVLDITPGSKGFDTMDNEGTEAAVAAAADSEEDARSKGEGDQGTRERQLEVASTGSSILSTRQIAQRDR